MGYQSLVSHLTVTLSKPKVMILFLSKMLYLLSSFNDRNKEKAIIIVTGILLKIHESFAVDTRPKVNSNIGRFCYRLVGYY